ncbi:AMP-dependent synthetase/ligase [Caenimonas aquaedulcis]|uniref:AMP-binding protein n=1 Tax=Caenimonas aquaedulcis TaxID=2793270 RepID=A0A931H3U9_9BURK|nr:AMP-binding protein [Caenimonas aquaedulcis]MBG9388027.1 AMP-binding protein [Caenimonas aquaedulcis]
MPKPWNLTTTRPPEHSAAVPGDSVVQIFWNACERRADTVAMRQKHFGIWRGWRWREVGAAVRELALGFVSLGLEPGECVSILSNTRMEWVWCDLAVQTAGGVANGIYPSDPARQVRFVCEDSATVLLVVEDEEQLDKVLGVREHLPLLRHIVLLNAKGLDQFADPMVITLEELRRQGAAFDAAHPEAFGRLGALRRPGDLAALIYTSGTTGQPLGTMHSHRGLAAAVRAQVAALPQDERDERMCFLPLCHVAERVAGCYVALCTGAVLNFVENPDTVAENVREIAPTVFGGVPRLWEKFYSAVTIAVQEAGPVQQALYRWSLDVGHEVAARVLEGEPVGFALRLKYRLAGIAALDHVRRFIGIHRCRYLTTGAAPISPELVRWYLALGVPMLESWGLAEACGLSTSMPAASMRPGSVGKALPGTEVRVDAASGELAVRGPHVFMGYLNQPERTALAFDDEGWLRTGDMGAALGDGYFRFDERKKDLMVTAGGRSFAPSAWENELKFSPYVTDAVVTGEGRSYLTAIVLIEQENVEKFAQDRDIPFSSYASLTRAPEVRALVQGEVDRVNRKLGQSGEIRKFFLLENQLGAEDEELAPTMRLKRRLVLAKYASQIEAMYA